MSDKPEPKATPTASAILQDGRVIEMLFDPAADKTSLLIWDGAVAAEQHRLEVPHGMQFCAYSPRNNLLAHNVILFPSAATDYDDQRSLLVDIHAFIHRYADLSEAFEDVASLYVLLSWVYDRYNVLPYLRVKGDYGTGKTRALQVIGSLCYKPMFVSGASTVSPMFRIIDAFRGTLILDESDFRFSDEKAEITKILNNGNASGFPVLRTDPTPTRELNPRAFTVFGPKIIATRKDFDDQALESRCITEVMGGLPPRKDIPLALPESFSDEARELRNKLLMYRFRELSTKPLAEEERSDHIEARVAQIFAPLLSIAPDEQSRERLIALAKQQTKSLRVERGVSVEAQLLDTLYVMRQDGALLYIRDVTTRFSERFFSDYDRPITPRWIGAQLRKRLALATVKSHGNYLIPESECEKLLRLFVRYEIGEDRVDEGTSGTF